MKPRSSLALCLLAFVAGGASPTLLHADAPAGGASPTHAEVIVYEGTPGGVMAAVAAARSGHSVILLEMYNHVGGVVSGGLTESDIGKRYTVGGLSAEFFDRTLKYYVDKYGPNSKQVEATREGIRFEPKVAELVFDQMLAEKHVAVVKRVRLRSITQDANGNITSLTADDLANGGTKTFTGNMFIDGSYEGDLLAAAKVPYRYGREGRDEYHEQLAGISAGPNKGKADDLIMAYNYRVQVTPVTENAVPFPKPEHYDGDFWSKSVGERIKKGNLTEFIQLYASGPGRAGPNDKLDTNWFDEAGSSYGYADGDWPTREKIAAKVRDHALSFLYYCQSDPDVPEVFRADVRKWGLPKDEFLDTGHFPFQLYVREARRMVGLTVLTEHDITQDHYKADGIGEGCYAVDCHLMQDLEVNGKRVPDKTPFCDISPYDIPYGCLVPQDKPGMPGNLLVPVCCSASHVAYCSLRMEPVYMILGQAAGDAAHLALAGKLRVQKVDVTQLRAQLRQEKAVLDAAYEPQVKIAFTPAHPKVGEAVQFRVENVEVREPLTQTYWDFEGNGKVGAQGMQAQNAFKLDKVYTVSLLVQDKAGRKRMVSAEVPVGQATARDVTISDYEADLSGRWMGDIPLNLMPGTHVRLPDVYLGPGGHLTVDKNGGPVRAKARFQPELARAGRYQLCMAFRPEKRWATNVPVIVQSADGTANATVDEQKEGSPFPLKPVGEYRFAAGRAGFVEISNSDADGQVMLNGLRWVWLGE